MQDTGPTKYIYIPPPPPTPKKDMLKYKPQYLRM